MPIPAHAAVQQAQPSAGPCKLAGTTGWLDEGHQTNYDVFLRPAGTLRAVMLFVDFPNARASAAPAGYRTTKPYYDWLAPAADWLARSSYGRLSLKLTPIAHWYRMSQPDTAYGISRGLSFATHAAYIREAVGLADRVVDFSAYDLVYVVPPRNAVGITFSPGFIDPTGAEVRADGVALRHGATFGQDIWSWGATGFEVLDHETAHTFGLPDLWAFNPPGPTPDFQAYTGNWDVMSQINGAGPDFFGWEKWKMGWLRDSQIDCVTKPGTTTHRLRPLEQPGGTKIVVIPTGATSAFVIESRQAVRNDAAACSTGVLMYTVDSSIVTGAGPIRVVDATPGDPRFGPCSDLDIATLGGPGRPTTFADAAAGVSITVTRASAGADLVIVTKRGH
ncbi:MAG: M6 family metalloprotease domain-containing protein [Chloroflexota bacterium]|nr:M6 family metalloprotease domain-containing protein [Chloroflexota bacterium]